MQCSLNIMFLVTFLPRLCKRWSKNKMVRMVYMNISYRLDFEINDPTNELWRNTEHIRRSKQIKIQFWGSTCLVLRSPATSGAPDRLIRSVSSSWYERNIPRHFLIAFFGPKSIFLWKLSKFPHFYRFAQVFLAVLSEQF